MAGVLLTDLYELTMLQAYFAQGMNGTAVFECFVRKLPSQRNFLIAAGLEQVLEYLAGLSFAAEELEWLRDSGRFRPDFVDSLADLAFTGDVDAMPEGTIFFADEPILRITAPLREAQLVESRILNLLHYETLIASKAVRSVLAAPDALLVDFGLRRAHGAEAGLLSARASYLAGFSGTATVEAGRRFGIPIYGTMAHSYVQAHDDETTAFEHFARTQPENAVLLIDTYDTERAAHKVVALAAKLATQGIAIKGVRIDSGDLGEHARRVRTILDAAGLTALTIFASGNLDEHRVQELVASRAPIDGFGIGTRMNTSADAPFLDCAYKLEEYEGRPRRKRSEGKATWPGRKQVYRRYDPTGRSTGDILALTGDAIPGTPLLQAVLRGGRPLAQHPGLAAARDRVKAELARVPEALRSLRESTPYTVDVASSVRALASRLDAQE
ncbi:MAG TPA: nicotinate phosphoribosyltransferase [Casimicrobiaceae bacterium]